MHISV